jgi:hypothetical protein
MTFFAITRRFAVLALLTGLPFLAQAGPMGFSQSWMSMGDFSPNWREVFVNYALTPRDAIGLETAYMRSDDKSRTRYLTDVTYTRLLQRWNSRDAQANLWFVGGIGTLNVQDQVSTVRGARTMVTPGIQFDYETTRVYFAATERLYRARGIQHDYTSARIGFSFYEAEYDETQPWLIVEARRMRDLSEKTEITPMLRLINKNYFIEAGINNSREPRFNFMYIF